MKKVITALLFMILSSNLFATAQMPDILLYKGETYPIFSNPLESYFNDDNPRPKDIFKFSCTASWRGYIATWKIEKNNLYLVKLVEGTCDEEAAEIPLKTIFNLQKKPIPATWFSGKIRIPMGERIQYVHMGYDSIYQKELYLSLEKGVVIGEELIDYLNP